MVGLILPEFLSSGERGDTSADLKGQTQHCDTGAYISHEAPGQHPSLKPPSLVSLIVTQTVQLVTKRKLS